MRENEAQMWLDELERRQHLMTEAEKKRSPGHDRGIPSEPENIDHTIQRLRAICVALEKGGVPEIIFQSLDN